MDDAIAVLLKHVPTKRPTRPYVNSVLLPHRDCTVEDRLRAAKKAGWNVFNFPSEMLVGDFLSDSGTGAMTLEQLQGVVSGLASNAYGTRPSYRELIRALQRCFGSSLTESAIFLANQGRAAETMLFETLRRLIPGEVVIPSNGHFDTTRANIEWVGWQAIDIPVERFPDNHFCGNIDLQKLRSLLGGRHNIPIVYITVTNNTYGGAPVSIGNIREAQKLCHDRGVSLFLDVCRFAENAWAIKQQENEFMDAPVERIVHEMFELCDGFTISFKKDGLSDTGGALIVKRNSPLARRFPTLHERLRAHQTVKIGHRTQGGMTGRDHYSIIAGLKTVTNGAYLAHRREVASHLADCFKKRGIPIVEPVGMHAVYVDMDRFFDGTRIKREDFGGIALTALLLPLGIRACELGAFAFGKCDPESGEETPPSFNNARFAIPRLKYEKEDLEYAADCVAGLHAIRDHFPRAVPVSGRELPLRHFEARFDLVPFNK